MARFLTLGFVLGLITTVAAGCGGGSSPPASSAGKPGAVKRPEVPAVTAAAPEQNTGGQTPSPPPYVYVAEGRRDPFQSILVTLGSGKSLQSLPPLLRTEIGELRLIGIVWGGFGYSAMVQTPDGKGYTIHVGTPVGPNNGSVRKITERYLTIEEKYTDIFGAKKVREVRLDLHPQKEGSE
ncbi:MAG TPA: pilus assembly protein PilP [Nitrospiria bacterium]|nr:pilus assembly protein PilP [Nitrospiria bacterium]HUK57521.1 pilus assembly protein PilP [Nitrospiria bacterium]